MFQKKLDNLEQAMSEAGVEVLERGLPYVELLKIFSEIVDICFGTQLKRDPADCIDTFKSKYLSLGISVTPKVIFTR